MTVKETSSCETKAGRAPRLTHAYRTLINNGFYYGKAWELWREGKREEALLLDRCAREAAWIAIPESADADVTVILTKEVKSNDQGPHRHF
jgi:hypothetical protein